MKIIGRHLYLSPKLMVTLALCAVVEVGSIIAAAMGAWSTSCVEERCGAVEGTCSVEAQDDAGTRSNFTYACARQACTCWKRRGD